MNPEFVPVDQVARRCAIETQDRPLLVEAGAGTGKTTLLVDRLVHALENGRVQMPRLVAISFTEKAAAELRLRLRLAIEARLGVESALDGPGRARLATALHEIDRATLSTIHAFAAGLLRERPVQARLDPQFVTLDELESAQLLREFWHRWVDRQLDGPSAAARLRLALLAGVRLEPDLYDLARELELQRDVIEGLRPPAADPQLESRLRDWQAGLRACVQHAAANCQDPADRGWVKLQRLAARLDALDYLDPTSWPGVFLEKFQVDASAGQKNSWQGTSGTENKAMRARLRAELVQLRQAIGESLLHGVLRWLEDFRSDYATEKRRRGVLDFQDLLLEARGLVRDDARTRRDLASRIDMLCVDEFQDTDPLQAELVLFLAEVGGPAPDWQQVRVGPQLFLVGDPRQSIYRFRRADLDVYERCAEIVLESGGLRLDIVQNFRSRPAVLEWVNGVFEPLFAPADGPRHVTLQPAVERGTTPAVWILRAPPPAPEANGGDWRRAEAVALAGWIRDALTRRLPVRDRGGEHPMRPGDIALLFGRTAGIELYETALRDAGLPFQQEGGRLYFQRQEVRDVLHALAAIDDPHDELAIVAALRSPLFGASDEELWLHRAKHGGFGYLLPPTDSALATRLAILERLHAARLERSVADTIAALLDVTEARAVLAARPQGVQALANVERLMRLSRRFEAGPSGGLRAFVRSLRDFDADAPRLAEWAPQDDVEDRVRLLTVHMAKGLEFPCVLLANLNAGGSSQRPAVAVDRLSAAVEVRLRTRAFEPIATAGWETIDRVGRDRDAAEERRLLYVAATRARDYLVVPRFQGVRPSGLLEALVAVPGAFGADAFGDLPVPGEGEGTWCLVDAAAVAAPRRVPAPSPRVDLRPLWARRAAWPAEHAGWLERGAAGAAILRPDGPRDVDPIASEWHRRRRLLAELSEAVSRRSHADAGLDRGARLAAVVAEVAARHRVPELEEALGRDATRLAGHALTHRAAASKRVHRGVQFTAWDGENWIEAWIDLLFEEDGGWILVDYRPRLEPDPSASPGGRDPLAWKRRALQAAGLEVREAAALDLDSGSYVVETRQVDSKEREVEVRPDDDVS